MSMSLTKLSKSVLEDSSNAKRRTLIRERVGCSRATIYDLPPIDFAYGMKFKTDVENAGEVISNWQTSDPSSGKETSKQIVHSNILAVSRGCITAKAMRQYTIDHPHIRRKETLHHTEARMKSDAIIDGPFGIKTITSEDKIADILNGTFHDWSTDDLDYPKKTSAGNVVKLTRPRSTAASSGIMLAREMERMKSIPRERFTMKKFQHIPGVLDFANPETLKVKAGSRRKLKPLNNSRIEKAIEDYNNAYNKNENVNNFNTNSEYDTDRENYEL